MKKLVSLLFLQIFVSQCLVAGFFSLSGYHSFGPLTNRSQNPIYLLFLDNSLEKAATGLNKKQWQVSLETTFSNIFELGAYSNKEKYFLDGELWRTALKVDYGVNDRLSMGVELSVFPIAAGSLMSLLVTFTASLVFPMDLENFLTRAA